MARKNWHRFEDLVDEAVHACALVLSLLALQFLTENAPDKAGYVEAASPILFGVTMLLVYMASAVNLRSRGHRAQPLLQAIDHCAIFLLIAGTYTPVSLLAFRDNTGQTLLLTVWMMAVVGILMRIFWVSGFSRIALGLYLGTGWIGAFWAGDLGEAVGAWLLAGGLAYTLGVAFFASRLPFSNVIWHLFVVAGSACHFYAVGFHILPSVA